MTYRDSARVLVPWHIAPAVGLACAGRLYFLGVIDSSFNIQNGMYTRAVVGGACAAALQIWRLG